MGNRRTPEIRFPVFNGDWEQRKLGEVAQYSNGGSFENEVVNKGKYELITLKSVDIDGNLVPSNKFINSEVSTLKKDTLVMILSEQAPGLLGKTSVIPFNNYYVLNQRVASLTPKEETDSNFLNKAINRNGKYFSSKGAGTKVQNISKPNVENFEFFIPEFKEQAQIGNFFKQLDDTIRLHQLELTTLKQTKQGFLQKIFPKEGETVPEIRFPGFTGDWEQCKLGEMSDGFEYGLNASATKYDGKNKYIRITDIDDNTHEFLKDNLTSPNIDLSSADNYLVKEGDILFARTGASVGKSYIYDKKDGKVYYAGFLIRSRIRSGYDPGFIFQNTLTSKYNEFIKITSQRSGQPGVNAQEYAKFSIMVPNYDEQAKIGNFFKQLDDTIALHQRKLETLKKTKKAFLQRMFV